MNESEPNGFTHWSRSLHGRPASTGVVPAAKHGATQPTEAQKQTTRSPALRLGDATGGLRTLVGLASVVFSAIYFISDLIELAQGDFSTFRLSLTYIGEAALPLFVLGLYAVQRPHIGWLGLVGALAYAYAYVFFTCTVVYALVAGTRNWHALTHVFGAWMALHGAVLVLGGLAFGWAVIQAGVLPRWTGACLMVGVVLVALASGSSNLARTIAAAGPAAAFIGMGVALLRNPVTAEPD